MLPINPHPFAADAQRIRARLRRDLIDPSSRIMDATIRSQRSGSRRFAFHDSLIGFGAALREVLLDWGIPDAAIYTNDTPVEGYFVGRKYWDFVVKDADGRAQVLVEHSRLTADASGKSLSAYCHELVGAMHSLNFTGRRTFVGSVFVCDATRTPLSAARRNCHRKRLERFARTATQAGLLDALTYLEVTPHTTIEPHAALSLERFLCRLYARLETLPEAAFRAAPVPSEAEGGCRP